VYFRNSPCVRRLAASPQHSFGARVRELRLGQDMTQEDLADRCGLFRTYMSRIETGRANPTLTMIHALAASLGVEVATLFQAGAAASGATAKEPRPSRGRVR
jgi:transcriptional regulator with XRE-family HTH domain